MDKEQSEREDLLRRIYAALDAATVRELRKILIYITGRI